MVRILEFLIDRIVEADSTCQDALLAAFAGVADPLLHQLDPAELTGAPGSLLQSSQVIIRILKDIGSHMMTLNAAVQVLQVMDTLTQRMKKHEVTANTTREGPLGCAQSRLSCSHRVLFVILRLCVCASLFPMWCATSRLPYFRLNGIPN